MDCEVVGWLFFHANNKGLSKHVFTGSINFKNIHKPVLSHKTFWSKYNTEGYMWPDPQAPLSFCGRHHCYWDQYEEHCSILAFSTLPSTVLLFSCHLLCAGVHTWAAWVTVTFMGLSPNPACSLEVSNSDVPPKGPNIPSINKSDWLNCRHTYIQVNLQQQTALGY